MKFKRVYRNDNYDVLRLLSDAGRWEMGLRSMMYGTRVRVSQVGSPCCVADYCAGASLDFQAELLLAVRIIMLKVPEEYRTADLDGYFPGYTIKPINNDPTCWEELKKMRDKISAETGCYSFESM